MVGFDFKREIERCVDLEICWPKLDGKTIMITGATGLMGRFLIEVLLKRKKRYNLGTKIIAVGRDYSKFVSRFSDVEMFDTIEFYRHDVLDPFDIKENIDVVFHMASNTHPRLYATDPIGTEMANILGTYNLLRKVVENPGCRFVFVSSGDIYGESYERDASFSETDCGYIDCNTLRAGYIEGKRASEALCNAFHEAANVDFVVARLCRIYGPTMLEQDSKAVSQFINNAVRGKDIVLKSEGRQVFSYLYVYDAVSALLTIAVNGKTTNAYNVADNNQAIALKELASILARIAGTNVVFDLPDEVEKKGASTFKNAKLDASKLYILGWKAEVKMEDGLKNTVSELRRMRYGY